MKHFLLLFSFFTVSMLVSCGASGSGTSYVNPHAQAHREMHQELIEEETLKESVRVIENLDGCYVGSLPCESCRGTELELHLYTDMTFHLKRKEKGIEAPEVFSGKYRVLKDRVIQLDSIAGKQYSFQKQQSDLILLGEDGKPLTSVEKNKYVFKPYKIPSPSRIPEDSASHFYIDKWENNITFHAFGELPSWSLEMKRDKSVHFKKGNEPMLVLPALKALSSIDPDWMHFRSSGETGEINISLTRMACQLDGSDKPLPYQVTVNLIRKGKVKQETFEGCGEFIPDPRLYGLWYVIKADSLEIRAADFEPKRPQLEMKVFDGLVYGNDGCNTFHGSIEFRGNEVIFGNMVSTLMACPNMDKSGLITSSLSGQRLSYSFDRDLFLYKGKKNVMVLRPLE